MNPFKPFSENRPIRAVQVGCGRMAQSWVERILKKRQLELVGLVDIQREAAEKTAAKFNLAPGLVFSTLEDAIKRAGPDVIFDITIPSAHHDVTLFALNAGCHVLGEKPMSENLEDAREMCNASNQAERLYMVTQNRRHLPAMVGIRNAIQSGLIGEISSLDADFFIGAHFGGFRDEMKHVLLLDMAIHTFDQARMLSRCDPVAVYCHEYNPRGSWYKSDAAAICVFEMSRDVVFTYRGSWAAEGFHTSWESNWRIVGTKGSIVWDGASDAKAQVVASSEGFIRPMTDLQISSVPLAHEGHDGVLEEFISALRTGISPQSECHDNIKSLAMCLSAVRSAEQKKRVQVNW